MALYLYQKTHNETGLKYLGYTSKDPFKYVGSGKYWIRHFKMHGKDISTVVLKECNEMAEIRKWGEYYSDLWNIIESNEWANLKPESGDGGNTRKGHKLSKEHRRKIGLGGKGKIMSEEAKKKISESKRGRKNPRYGATTTSDAHKIAMKKWWAERKMKENN